MSAFKFAVELAALVIEQRYQPLPTGTIEFEIIPTETPTVPLLKLKKVTPPPALLPKLNLIKLYSAALAYTENV